LAQLKAGAYLFLEFGRAAELRAEIAIDIVGEAPWKALRLRVARHIFKKHEHRKRTRTGMLEFLFSPPAVRPAFSAGKSSLIRTPFTTGLINPAALGVPGIPRIPRSRS